MRRRRIALGPGGRPLTPSPHAQPAGMRRIGIAKGRRRRSAAHHPTRADPGPLLRCDAVTETSAIAGSYRLTEEQQMLRDAVRDLADEQIAPRAAEIDRTAEFPEDVSDAPGRPRHPGAAVPGASTAASAADLLTPASRSRRSAAPARRRGLILAVQELGALPILLAGTDEQKERWLPDLAAGETAHRLRAHRGGAPAPTRPRSGRRAHAATATTTSSTAPSGSSATARWPTS